MRPIVMAGGLLVPPERIGEVDLDAVRRPNPAWCAWTKRAERWRGNAGSYPGPEPERMIACSGDLDGPYEGGIWLPAGAPGQPKPDVVRRYEAVEEMDLMPDGLALRPYQADALAAWAETAWGSIVAPCGAGKTEMGIAAMRACGGLHRTIVLVHTHDLAEQWRERIRLRLGVEAGLVGGGKDQRDRPVVVALMQTLDRWGWWERYEWGRRYGLVIQDEAHHAPCSTLAAILSSLPCFRRLGLTATPTREDGLTDWIWWSCGPMVHRIMEGDLEEAGATMRPEVRRVRSDWEPSAKALRLGWAAVVGELVTDGERNALLLRLARDLVRDGRVVLLLTDRVDHATWLAAQLDGEALVGPRTKRQRAATLEAARSGDLLVVTATTVADEGLDLPRLDAVILACPSKNEGRVQQRIGRALRPGEGKRAPVVLDVVDSWGPLQGWAKKRAALYRRLGWGVV